MGILFDIFIILGLLTLVFLSPACMNVGLSRVSHKDYTIDKNEFLMSSIPIYNHFYGWNKYSGRPWSLSGISCIIFYAAFGMRAIVMFYFFDNADLQTYTVWAFLIAILIFWVCNAIDIFRILSDSGVYTFSSRLFFAFSVVIGHIIVGYYMPRKMYYFFNKTKKGTLYGRG